MTWKRAADLAVTETQDITRSEISGRDILLCRWDDAIYAVENQCSHARKPMEDGMLDDCMLICPWHGGSFCLKDGSPQARPALRPIATFPTKIEDDAIWVDLPD
jgi:3-phenylpropionate/trans-cinnamate dioxygenase ferredoxin subunit